MKKELKRIICLMLATALLVMSGAVLGHAGLAFADEAEEVATTDEMNEGAATQTTTPQSPEATASPQGEAFWADEAEGGLLADEAEETDPVTPATLRIPVNKVILNTDVDVSLPKVDIDIVGPKLKSVANVHASAPMVDIEQPDVVTTGPKFQFILSPVDGAPSPEVSVVTITGSGRATFAPITFTEAGEYQYVMSEIAGSEAHYRYDSRTIPIKVTVTEQDGALTASWNFVNPSMNEEPTFFNTYQPDATEYQITARKVLSGGDLQADSFTFQLCNVWGDVLSEAKNAADGTVTFAKELYTRAGIYEYVIKEVDDGLAGFTYDTTVYSVTVTVTDMDGKLVATADKQSGDLVFHNRYQPEATTLTLTMVSKELTGGTLEAGEFRFRVENAELGLTATGTNDADGHVTFPDITFSKAGTFDLTVSEINDGKDGIIYDTATHTVRVTVTDVGARLVATVAENEAGIVFHNRVKPEAATLTVTGKKVLSGGQLKDGMFSFVIRDAHGCFAEKGAVVAKGTNLADGTISFDPITFEEAGKYHFLISEEEGSRYGMTYDKTTYPLTVIVTEADGVLTATASMDSAKLVFYNTYQPAVPRTGDGSIGNGLLVLGAMLGIALIAGTLVYALRKK